jgi:hypothetical protein
MSLNEIVNVLAAVVGTAALLLYVSLVVTSLVQVVRSRTIETLARVGWVLAIIAFPLFGTMAWFLVGHKTKSVLDQLSPHARL